MNPQTKMFNQGMKPVYRIGPKGRWERLTTDIIHSCGEGKNFCIRFRFKFSGSTDPVFFAFSYPYSFEEVVQKVDTLEQAFKVDAGKTPRPDAVYFARETLGRSLDGRRVELLTITDWFGVSDQRESLIPGLFPGAAPESRPHAFPEKTTFFLSARVHPGESPAQWMWEGFVDLICSKEDPRAKALRRNFVFKIVPIINPDGVARGHYRADTQGLNLNRYYDNPDPAIHPTIFAVKEAVCALNATGRLKYFVDLHAHATKRGCFCYANALPKYQDQVENMLFARLISINCPHFDFGACVFSEKAMESKDKNGQSKEGSSRVGVYRATNIIHSITVECNYNGGRVVGPKPAPAITDGRVSPGENWRGAPPKFTDTILRDVGKAIAIAALDLQGANQWSRVPNSNQKTLDELREWLRTRLISVEPYRSQLIADKQLEKAEAAKGAKESKQDDVKRSNSLKGSEGISVLAGRTDKGGIKGKLVTGSALARPRLQHAETASGRLDSNPPQVTSSSGLRRAYSETAMPHEGLPDLGGDDAKSTSSGDDGEGGSRATAAEAAVAPTHPTIIMQFKPGGDGRMQLGGTQQTARHIASIITGPARRATDDTSAARARGGGVEGMCGTRLQAPSNGRGSEKDAKDSISHTGAKDSISHTGAKDSISHSGAKDSISHTGAKDSTSHTGEVPSAAGRFRGMLESIRVGGVGVASASSAGGVEQKDVARRATARPLVPRIAGKAQSVGR